jgi:hypothetical protein
MGVPSEEWEESRKGASAVKKLIYALLAVALAVALVSGYDFWALRNARGQEVAVAAPEFSAAGVLLRTYACKEAAACQRLYLGLADSRLAVTVEAPPARGIFLGPNYSDLRNDRPSEVRILRKHLGFLWVADRTVRFDVAREKLPLATAENQAALLNDLENALAAAK